MVWIPILSIWCNKITKPIINVITSSAVHSFGDCPAESCSFAYGAKFALVESSFRTFVSVRVSNFPRRFESWASFSPKNQLLAHPAVVIAVRFLLNWTKSLQAKVDCAVMWTVFLVNQRLNVLRLSAHSVGKIQSFGWLSGSISLLACTSTFYTTFLHLHGQGMTNVLAETSLALSLTSLAFEIHPERSSILSPINVVEHQHA